MLVGLSGWRPFAKRSTLSDMDHRMSDTELRRAIRELRDRADDARGRHDDEAADAIEHTIRGYQDEMATRL